jgi:hypothetical protein
LLDLRIGITIYGFMCMDSVAHGDTISNNRATVVSVLAFFVAIDSVSDSLTGRGGGEPASDWYTRYGGKTATNCYI